jgi:hypothetical protein
MSSGMSGGRIALIIIGSILALASLGLLAGGGTLLWAHTTQRDDDGFYSTRFERFESPGYAIRSEDLDLGTDGPDWLFEPGRLGTIRLNATSGDPAKELLLGIGPKDAVESFLRGVEHDVVVDVGVDPFEAEYRHQPGSRALPTPGTQPFWATVANRRLEWEVEEGDWVAVVMNADGSRGVAADLSVAAKSDLILWVAIGSLAAGLLLGGLAALLILRGSRRSSPDASRA